MVKHPFHIVNPSPWPLLVAMALLSLVGGVVGWLHNYGNVTTLVMSVMLFLFTLVQWWRDVSREATFQGKHTEKVQNGLRFGMILFITSEVFFFLAFFWAFFHSSLSPSLEIGGQWPPLGITVINPFDVPLLNTTVLLTSGVSITWAHYAVMENNWKESCSSLWITVILGVYFSLLQFGEYLLAPFSIADSVYGSTFYLATGFHGIHVIVGTMFISVMLYRNISFHMSKEHHFGFEASAWYWHFVDVVWLFLFMCIYWWGFFFNKLIQSYRVHTSEMSNLIFLFQK
uniref:Cytochrome c oxidase subunit 3 n=1 Tax=Spadella cephaloptera TaxID=52888 RepID=A0A141CKE9_9BILA|nr:Cytochrome c oxidase subunit 3 [Spadella cephaloptera]